MNDETIEEDYPTTKDYRREDLKKAAKIILLSVIFSGIVTAILYYLPI